MQVMLWVLTFVAGMATTIALEILGLRALLEPLQGPMEFLLGMRS